jgi:hypothetical protein
MKRLALSLALIIVRLYLLLALLIALTGLASAQTVQQNSQRFDAATFAVVSTNYNTINQQAVATVTPPAGQFIYITRIELEVMQNATGTAVTNLNFTSTGLGTGATASPQWGVSLPLTANATLYRDINMGTPLRTAIAGQNVTITSPAALASTAYGIKIYGYFSP